MVATKEGKLLIAAKNLLLNMLTDFPDDVFNKNSGLKALGDIQKHFENYPEAIKYYKQAIDFEKIYPNVPAKLI